MQASALRGTGVTAAHQVHVVCTAAKCGLVSGILVCAPHVLRGVSTGTVGADVRGESKRSVRQAYR